MHNQDPFLTNRNLYQSAISASAAFSLAMASPLTAAKQQLRSLMKQKLSSITQDSITSQSRRIFEALQEFQPYKDANRISIYLAMPTAEVQTDAIVRHALAAGKQVFVPYLHRSPLQTPDTPTRVMDMVHLENLQDYEGLKLDRWGIPSVDPATVHQRRRILGGPDAQHSEQATLDFMVVPGVAFDFDEAGSIRRLGHGKGFYDFFINRYVAKTETKGLVQERPLLLYALALTEQLVPASSELRVPTDTHDRSLNGLILGNGEVKVAPSEPDIP
ncbi:hypothetical protein FZEAL_6934 [Fusarium zealandicum]|uniref:5-formyltetrahydrofolate cyclo-ligase n=1 Tax=Fusarium zealandicum TaxID=1053134 RepID=A0A8H4UHM8_9HYPO|nr:hypothetical protein FZEAL_6934 [Fusarium zealandicum]